MRPIAHRDKISALLTTEKINQILPADNNAKKEILEFTIKVIDDLSEIKAETPYLSSLKKTREDCNEMVGLAITSNKFGTPRSVLMAQARAATLSGK